IQSYKSRFTRALDSYREFLDSGQPPRSSARRTQADGSRRAGRRPGRSAPTSEAASPSSQEVGGGSGDRLIDYPFPLRSSQIAVLRLPLRLDREDAERMA